MHFLLTNDDGIDAPGLVALYHAIEKPHRVSIVAPARERSACSHTVTLWDPMRVRQFKHEVMGPVFAAEGAPADCVRLAIAKLVDEPIDCVVSGINRGANISIIDVASSGTVAAAREAAFSGLRAISVSQLFNNDQPIDWPRSTRIVRGLVNQLIDPATPRADVWSINLPVLHPGRRLEGVRVAPLSTDQIPLVFDTDGGPLESGEVFTYSGIYEDRTVSSETDLEALLGGYVTVTPLSVDPTNHAMLDVTLRPPELD